MATFADRLNEALELRDIKPSELSRLTGIKESSISSYRSGKYDAGQQNIDRLAQALNVSIPWLMGLVNDINDKSKSSDTIEIPIMGKIVAGSPTDIYEDIIGYEKLPQEMSKHGTLFALSVKGHSMEPNIMENDIVIVQKQDQCEDGEIAIVLVNGSEATVKQVHKNNAGIILIGFNTSVYQPHFYTDKEVDTLPVRVIGKVIGLHRKF